MASRASLSRSLMSAARSSAFRSLPRMSASRRIRQPPITAPRRLCFSNPRTLGELACSQSLMPLPWGRTLLTSHLAANLRACCELSHGT